jgi:hypothetical protein
MRQQKLGEWPAMSYAAAIAEWQHIRARRDAGEDPVLTRNASNRPVMVSTPESYTVRKLCEDFLTGHIDRHRDSLGAALSRRRIMTKITPIAGLPAASVTRKQAFDLLDGNVRRRATRRFCVRSQAPRGITHWMPAAFRRTRQTGGAKSCAAN